MTEHEIKSTSFDELRIIIKTRYESIDNQSIMMRIIILFRIWINSIFDELDTRGSDKRDHIKFNFVRLVHSI